MPIIIDKQEIKVINKGTGWKIYNLADVRNFGSAVMTEVICLRYWVCQLGARKIFRISALK